MKATTQTFFVYFRVRDAKADTYFTYIYGGIIDATDKRDAYRKLYNSDVREEYKAEVEGKNWEYIVIESN